MSHHIVLIHSPVERYSGCSYTKATVNNASVNMGIHCVGSRGGIPLWTKVMRKEAWHTQMRGRASGVHPAILEHLPPRKPESAYCIALCSHL